MGHAGRLLPSRVSPILPPMSESAARETLDFIRALPKTETHLHLEGALPWDFLRRLDPLRFRDVPASWREDFRFASFSHFEEELLGYVFAWFVTPERYHQAAQAIFQHHLEQNVKYVECSFASGVVEFGGVDGEATAQAIRDAVPSELTVRIFLGIHRNGYNERTRDFLDACVGWSALDGLDLHGPETLTLERWSARLWRQAREAGKHTKAHAGEFGGPESVRQVLDELGVRRIEHGVRAVEDPRLVERLRNEGIALDVCPTSNVKLGVAASLESHPLRALFDAGVTCTVSSDDPISFGNCLTDEYVALAARMGFSRRELARVALNGFRVALCDRAVVAPHVAELEALAGEG
ncbi:MAG: adenosine deaminase family protein [Gemmatimonadota bacterium]